MNIMENKYITYWSENRQFGIPAILIAEHRADYYAVDVDRHEKGSQGWKEEVDYALNDDYELKDWLLNNCDPKDFWKDTVLLHERFVEDCPSEWGEIEFQNIDSNN